MILTGFLVKFSLDGTFQWVRTWGSNASLVQTYAFSVAVDNHDVAYVGGSYGDTVNFDSPAGSAVRSCFSGGACDGSAYVVSFGADGAYHWVQTFGGEASRVNGVAFDGADGLLLVGQTHGSGDWDPGPGVAQHTVQGFYDAFILKLGTDGSYVWSRFVTDSGDGTGHAVAADAQQNVYAGGSFAGTANFDEAGGDDHTAVGTDDAFLVKYGPAGDYQWGRSWGGPGAPPYGGSAVTGIAVGPEGVTVAGSFAGTVDFDPGPDTMTAAANITNIFASRFSSDGNWVWTAATTQTILGDQSNGTCVVSDPVHGVYVGGDAAANVDFNPTSGVDIPPRGAFLWHLGSDGAY